MRDGKQSLDLLVRGEDGPSLHLTASDISVNHLTLVGTLVDVEPPHRAEVTIEVVFAPDFVEGAHVQHVSDLKLVTGDVETRFHWEVENHELPDGYLLRDVRVFSDEGEIRAFAIEDLAATVGIGLAAAVSVVIVWRSHKRAKQARIDADQKWSECLAKGCSPSWEIVVKDEAALDPEGLPTIGSSVGYRVRCDCSRGE